MKIKSLIPVPYSNIQEYLKEFYVINKIKNSDFNYRTFAKELSWPASYLHDVTVGRKKLSIQRALQFIDYFKMNNINKEHLLWLTLQQTKKEKHDAKEAYKKKTDPNSLLYNKDVHDNLTLQNDVAFISFLYLWKRKRLSAEQILNEFAVPSLSIDRITKAAELISKKNIFLWDEKDQLLNPYIDLSREFDHSDTKGDQKYEGIELHKDAAINFLEFINKPQSPSTYHSRVIAIPKDQFMPIAMKIIELRNWIDEISNQHIIDSKAPEQTSRLMQLDLNLFPIQKNSL